MPITMPTLISQTDPSRKITLVWDANTEPNLTGYKIYIGQNSRIYSNIIDVGNTVIYTINNLTPGTYFFAATAYDSSLNESGFSNEITIKILPLENPPVISNTSAFFISTEVIKWSTDVISDSQVEYGITNKYGNTTPIDTTLVVAHRITLTNLQSGKIYHYRVKSKTINGTLSMSGDKIFTAK